MAVSILLRRVGRLLTNPSEGDQLVFIGKGTGNHPSKLIWEIPVKKRFPGKILQAINKKVGTTVLTKYGTKRGGIAIGKLIPFGVGVVVGGGFNYIMMKRFKTSSIKYLRGKIEKRQSLTKADS